MPLFLRGRGGQTLAAFAAYVALTIAMTWPITRGISRDVPADLGDALLNMWIMAWDSEALVAMASGRMSFADLWHGNIFHPSPLSLTFSEHLLQSYDLDRLLEKLMDECIEVTRADKGF